MRSHHFSIIQSCRKGKWEENKARIEETCILFSQLPSCLVILDKLCNPSRFQFAHLQKEPTNEITCVMRKDAGR